MDDPKWYVPNIPLEDLFTVQDYPDPIDDIPLRWWSKETTIEYLGVAESTVRRYKAEGKLEYKYLMVKGHRKVYYTNRSVIRAKRGMRTKEAVKESEDTTELEGIDMDGFTEDEVLKLEAISYLLSTL